MQFEQTSRISQSYGLDQCVTAETAVIGIKCRDHVRVCTTAGKNTRTADDRIDCSSASCVGAARDLAILNDTTIECNRRGRLSCGAVEIQDATGDGQSSDRIAGIAQNHHASASGSASLSSEASASVSASASASASDSASATATAPAHGSASAIAVCNCSLPRVWDQRSRSLKKLFLNENVPRATPPPTPAQ